MVVRSAAFLRNSCSAFLVSDFLLGLYPVANRLARGSEIRQSQATARRAQACVDQRWEWGGGARGSDCHYFPRENSSRAAARVTSLPGAGE
jgi:hypothetical protein